MRISELVESAETILTYLTLLDKDVTQFEYATKSVMSQYNEDPTKYKEAARHYITEINLRILAIVHDTSIWDRFKTDPEISIAYDRYVNLYNSNDDFLASMS